MCDLEKRETLSVPPKQRVQENTTMCIGLTVACAFLWCHPGFSEADEPLKTDSRVKRGGPAADAILREACEIALKQNAEQHYWTDRVLLHIGELQIQAGDFDGALKSIRGSTYPYGHAAGLVHLAEAVARQGRRERGLEILRLLGSDHGWRQDYMEDGVQLRWIEYLNSSGKPDAAVKAVEELKSKRYRPEALRKIAVAYAKSRKEARTKEYFKLSIDTASELSDDFDRARALWETADAQLAVGESDAANATIRLLLEKTEIKDAWTRCVSFTECAVLAAKAKDDETAHRLFRRAIEARNAVDSMNTMNALMQIAKAQGGVGYLDEAFKTACMITQDDCYRQQALYEVAVAQLKADDAEAAIRSAMSIEHYLQFRDDAIHKIVDHRITKRDFKAALATAEKAPNPSKRAAAILKVAKAHAHLGDYKTAAAVADRIELTPANELLRIRRDEQFNYRLPRSWGVRYDDSNFFTMLSHHMSSDRAAEVAAAAMTLAQTLREKPNESYAILFNDINTEEIIRALARAHAASGDPSEALAWAKKIGSNRKADSDDDKHAWAVQRRIHALVGVAEGLLERSGDLPAKADP
jgi:tetratricopeptide (TPR) repeat protein